MNLPWFNPPASAPSRVGAAFSSFARSADARTSLQPFDRGDRGEDELRVSSRSFGLLQPAAAAVTSVATSIHETRLVMHPPRPCLSRCSNARADFKVRFRTSARPAHEFQQLAVGSEDEDCLG